MPRWCWIGRVPPYRWGEGAVAPSGASRQTWLLLPQVGGFAPTAPREGALRPSTPGDFLPDEKVTKESPRGESPSGYSLEGDASLPLQHIVLLPPQKGFRHNKRPICHFELVGKSVLFFSLVSSRKHSVFFNPWRGRCITLRMLEGLSHCNQYR